jgi:arylsulfatase A-like enzyme
MLKGLRTQLDQLGVARNTYVVFTSDNGFHLGQHRLPPGKETAFDTDVQVPLVITGPGVEAGQHSDALASNVDLRPTFDHIAGASISPKVDGRSLLPLLGGQPSWNREAVLVEHHGPLGGPGDPDVPADTNTPTFVLPTAYEAIRTQTELWVEYVDGEVEHYDIATDPDELDEDSASLTPEHRAHLHDLLMKLETCHGQAQCEAAASS